MRYLISFFLVIIAFAANAQNSSGVEMADTFRADGKIYVVVAVMLILLLGLFAYLIMLDRKITKLEKDKNKEV